MGKAESDGRPSCWVVSDGRAGNENQCLGLARALGLAPEVKRIRARAPWRWLAPSLWLGALRALDPLGDTLAPPWPKVLIATGRISVAPAAALRRASRGATFAIQIQNPTIDPGRFDVVVAPAHDRLSGPKVIVTLGAMHGVDQTCLEAAAARFGPRLAHLPRPRIAVLIGGDSKVHRLPPEATRRLTEQLARLARRDGAGLMVTTSRRTVAENQEILRRGLEGLAVDFWDGTDENPYYGYLALAEGILVTADSVNMVSEAAATGKPVQVVDLEGGSARLERFHRAMGEAGITRPFDGHLERWSYPIFNEPQRVAAEIGRRMAAQAGTDTKPT
jgi:mitochondrial fission protein ELM1